MFLVVFCFFDFGVVVVDGGGGSGGGGVVDGVDGCDERWERSWDEKEREAEWDCERLCTDEREKK